jgi:site-specific recombinase XerD
LGAQITNDKTEEIRESAFRGSVARSHGSPGMSGVGLHKRRHSFATHMLAASVPLHTVSELLGHPSVAVTDDVYDHVANQGARSAVDRLSAAMGW